MYPRPRFLETLHAIREEMSREADYDVELFAERVREGEVTAQSVKRVNVRSKLRVAASAESLSEPHDEADVKLAPKVRNR